MRGGLWREDYRRERSNAVEDLSAHYAARRKYHAHVSLKMGNVRWMDVEYDLCFFPDGLS